MNQTDFKVGDRVIVSACVTGTGENMPGWIDNIETFCGATLITVSYERPTAIGDLGACIRNIGMISKAPKEDTKAESRQSLEASCDSDVCAYRGLGLCDFKEGEFCPMYEPKQDHML